MQFSTRSQDRHCRLKLPTVLALQGRRWHSVNWGREEAVQGQGPAPAGHCQLAELSRSKRLRHRTLTAGLLSLHLPAGRPALTFAGWHTLHLEELSACLLYGTVSLLIYTFTRPRAHPRCEASAVLRVIT